MSGGGGGTSEYWPGFVDALTNVVIAMVFVIVVLAIALSFAMQIVASRMAGKLAELQAANVQLQASQKNPQVEPRPVRAPSTDTPLPAPADARVRIAVAGNERNTPARPATVNPATRSLVLEYEQGALTLDDVAQKNLVLALGPVKVALEAAPAGTRVALVATGPSLELSDNQRAAFLRLMAVRNQLLEQGVPAARIATRLDPQGPGDMPRVVVTMEDAK
jgi:hypothetical protein